MTMIDLFNRVYSVSKFKINISNNIPKKNIDEIFRPYLFLFMMYRYSNCETTRFNYKEYMISKLRKFAKESREFGKIVLKRKIFNKKGYTITYNLQHINFIDDNTRAFATNHSTMETQSETNMPYLLNSYQFMSINRMVDVEMDHDYERDNYYVRYQNNDDESVYSTSSDSESHSENDETSNNNSENDDDTDIITIDVDGGTIPLNDVTRICYDEFLMEDGTLLNRLFDELDVDNTVEEVSIIS